MANELQQLADVVKTDLNIKKIELQVQVDRLAIEANHRLDELAKNEIKSPAYSQWVQSGKIRFGVRGKTYQQVQSEFWRIKNFLDAKTSTVDGAKDVLSQISRNTGYAGKSGELTQDEATEFFQLADRISDYYKMSGESAKALDYQKIWEQINIAVRNGDTVLDGVEKGVREIEQIAKVIEVVEKEIEAIEQNPIEALTPPKDIVGYGGFGNRVIGTIKGVGKAIGSFFKGLFGK